MKTFAATLGYLSLVLYLGLACDKCYKHGPGLSSLQLVMPLVILLLDLALVKARGRREMWRTSHWFVLASFGLDRFSGLLSLAVHSIFSAYLSKELPKTERIPVIGHSLMPLALAGLAALVLPSNSLSMLIVGQVYLFFALAAECETPPFQNPLLRELAVPGLSMAVFLFATHAGYYSLLLLLPVAVAIALKPKNDPSLLKRFHSALQESKARLDEQGRDLTRTKEKFSSMDILIRAAPDFADTLEESEIRTKGAKYLRLLGVSEFSFLDKAPTASNKLDAMYFSLGEGRGALEVREILDDKTMESLVVLTEMMSVNLKKSRLHHQVLDTLDQLKDSQARLVAQNQLAAVGRVAAGMAHEVNTPLGAIKLNLESGLHNLGKDSSKVESSIQRALSSVEKAGQNVARILNYSKPSGGDEPAVEFSPAAVTAACAQMLSHRFRGQKIHLQHAVCRESLLFGIEREFYSLVSNLLLNAAEAAYDSADRTVRVSLQPQGNTLELRVEDSGPGVPPEIVEQIFESFFTTKGSGQGSGLGLYLVSQVAENFDANIELSNSESLGGACFTVTFPLNHRLKK